MLLGIKKTGDDGSCSGSDLYLVIRRLFWYNLLSKKKLKMKNLFVILQTYFYIWHVVLSQKLVEFKNEMG